MPSPTAELPETQPDPVLRYATVDRAALAALLLRLGLRLQEVPGDRPIPGSFWGGEEAGLVGARLLVRGDSPVHSILHEACHYVCMDNARRMQLHTNAGGDYDEENAVCYLQILLADHVEHFGRQRMFRDMDRWGYSFRLGSAQAWFEKDADEVRARLFELGLTDEQNQPTFKLREY